jgi:prepilin-type N-terminal cleavage/methylation domain-containing protein
MRELHTLLGRLGRRNGFSLVEVLIGMTILAIALASAFALSVANARIVERNQSLSVAVSLAESKMEEMRNRAFDNIVTGSDEGTINSLGQPDNGGNYTRAWIVSMGGPGVASNDLKTVVVTTSWSLWGDAQTYSLTGVIAQ